MKQEKGFTFVEVLVVVIIVAVMIGLTVPAVGSLLNSSDSSEFVTNAKSVEEGAHMHYRDNGVMPTQAEVNSITEKSEDIIISHMVAAGVHGPRQVLDDLLDRGYIYSIDKDRLREYTRAVNDYEGIEDFIIIDIVDVRVLSEDDVLYDFYDNQLAGYVFSVNTVTDGVGNEYSGSYRMTDDTGAYIVPGSIENDGGGNTRAEVVYDDDVYDLYVCDDSVTGGRVTDPENGSCVPADIIGEGDEGDIVGSIPSCSIIAVVDEEDNIRDVLSGVGVPCEANFEIFDVENTEDNGDGTYNIDVIFGERIVDDNRRLIREFIADDFELNYSGPASGVIEIEDNTQGVVTIERVPYSTNSSDELEITLTSETVVNDNLGSFPLIITEDISVVVESGTDTSIPVDDTEGGDGGDETRYGDDYDDRDELYDHYLERDGTTVEVVTAGLMVGGLQANDRVVLKELRNIAGSVVKDENRTRLFIVKGSSFLIPKDPYLQRDFQFNPFSTYEYVVETYQPEREENSGPPENAHLIRYD